MEFESTPLARSRGYARSGGAEGNSRLTGLTAAVLLVLLAAEGFTLLSLRSMMSVHIFVGLLLIPPIGLKLATTGWRFMRYYTGRREYVLRGAPHALLRFIVAPGVILTTFALFGTGVALIAVGPNGGIWLGLHKASFALWLVAMGAHVLAHLWRVPGLAVADYRRGGRLSGGMARAVVVMAALAVGVTVASIAYPSAHAWLHLQFFGDG